jgi:hypothetical protein
MPSPGGRIEVKGLDAAIRNTRALGDQGTRDAIKKANYEAAQTLVTAAKPLAPARSGKLRASIRANKTLRYAAVTIGNARVPYAGPIIFGWFYDKEYFIQKNIKPNYFTYRALGYNKEKIMAKYEKDMQAALKKYQLD